MNPEFENKFPARFEKCPERAVTEQERDDKVEDKIDEREIFDLIRNIKDPEHPMSLEELGVVDLKNITIDHKSNEVKVMFTPTIPHCSMAQLIGLTLRVYLWRCLPRRFRILVEVTPGSHVSESAINKQLADKERVAAAMENSALMRALYENITPALS